MRGPGGGPHVFATVVVFAVMTVGLIAFAPTAAAQDSGTYVVEQGDECFEVEPVGDGTETVEEFYDYRNNDTEPRSKTYSSYGTLEYQEDNTSHLLIHDGAEGTSLVVVHERLHEDDSGSDGGHVQMTFEGLPADSEWAVMDDDYDGQQDDTFDDSGSTKYGEWYYDQSRTDGGAIRDVGGATSMSVEPTFNEDPWGGTYDGVIQEWKVVTDPDGSTETLAMDEVAIVGAGTCGEGGPGDPEADLSAPDEAEVDETVTLDASDSEAGADATYEWFVDGESVAEGPEATYETSFSETGTYDLRVEVTDEDGTGAAETTVEIYDGPTASFEASPSSVEAGNQMTFNGNHSTGDVTSYGWDFDDGSSGEGEMPTHTYEEAGTYEVELTVTDESGRQDSVSETVEVTEPTGPNAALSAPETASTGETVTLDASDSEAGADATYEWFVDEERVAETEAPTYETAFENPGSHSVRVQVTDADGSDGVGATVEVEGSLEADADAVPKTVEEGESITFDGSGSTGDVSGYEWTLGDGTSVSGMTPTHTYEEPGTYLAELTVENDQGESSTDAVEVTVEEADGGTSGDSGGGSGDTGSSGGDGGTIISDDDPDVEMDDGTAVVTVGDVDAGEPVEFDLSSDGASGSAVEVATVEVVPAEDADELTVRFEPVDRNVPGRFTGTSALDPMTNTELESITYEFAVDPEAMAGAGVTEENLTAYAVHDKQWSAVETGTETEGDRLVASATVEGAAPVGLGADGPALYVTDVRSDGTVTDSTLDLVATVRNTGAEAGERTLVVTAGGEPTEVPVSLEAGEETEIETNVTVDDPEDLQLRAGATRHDVLVVTTSDLSVEPTTIEAGEAVTVEAVVRNHGETAGEADVELVLADSVASVERVQVEPGEEGTVTFEQRIESPGTYELAVGDASETVTVEGDDGGAIGDATEDAPGFGAAAALFAFLVAVLGLRRRRR